MSAASGRAANASRYNFLEGAQGFNTLLFGYARTLVRAAEERTKPNEDRLAEFGDAGEETRKVRHDHAVAVERR